jgi:hypothetical protein
MHWDQSVFRRYFSGAIRSNNELTRNDLAIGFNKNEKRV